MGQNHPKLDGHLKVGDIYYLNNRKCLIKLLDKDIKSNMATIEILPKIVCTETGQSTNSIEYHILNSLERNLDESQNKIDEDSIIRKKGIRCDIYDDSYWYSGLILWVNDQYMFIYNETHDRIFIVPSNSKQIKPWKSKSNGGREPYLIAQSNVINQNLPDGYPYIKIKHQSKIKCPICSDQIKSCVFNCGHTVCMSCSLKTNFCYYCDALISERHKLIL